MKKILNSQDIKRFVFYSENAYVIHVGQHYEDLILKAQKEMKPVITVKNVNHCNSSIPLERALSLLEKYYKITRNSPKAKEEKETTQGMNKAQMVEEKETKYSKTALADSY